MAISKQSTRLDKEEEKKEKFNFAFFSSCFDTATIAAGKEVEKIATREPEQTPPRRRTPLARTTAWSRRRIGVGHNGGQRRHSIRCGAGGQFRGNAMQQSTRGGREQFTDKLIIRFGAWTMMRRALGQE